MQVIGDGSLALVRVATEKATGKQYALKAWAQVFANLGSWIGAIESGSSSGLSFYIKQVM